MNSIPCFQHRSLRHFLIILAFALSMVAAHAQSQEKYNIRITVAGLEDSVAYLGYHFGNKKYLQDTSLVSDQGMVLFEGDRDLKTGVYFLYSKNYYLEFIVDEQNFELETTKASAYPQMQVSNSPSNEQFKLFQLLMIGHQTKIGELTEQLGKADTKEDSLAIYDQVKALNVTNRSARDSLLISFGGTYVAQILRLMNKSPELTIESDSLTIEQRTTRYVYYKSHFFDGLDFTTEGLMRTPLFYPKVTEYIDKVTFQNPDSVIASVDYVLGLVVQNEEAYRFWLVTFFQKYQNAKIMGMDKVFVHIADNYYLAGKADWADDEMMKKLSDELVFHRENQIGLKAPQIYLMDTLRQPANLYAVQSEYIVLYFYDPDCGHCKKKTPVLKEVYEKMGDDLEVMAVCVGTDIKKWKNFIKEFELDWINLADLDYKSNFRVQYNVRSTPTMYILDRDKNIIAKKLDVEQIESFIVDRRRVDGYKNQ